MIRDYSEFPPLDCFKKVLEKTPKSALLYASIYKLKSKSNKLSIKKKQIIVNFSTTPTLFKNSLNLVKDLGLISLTETPEYLVIDFYDSNAK